jgi:heme O synthase-like polyprenyltransferase
LGLFSEVLASDGKTNLRGKNKGARLVERFGACGFDYAGNSRVDLPVWKEAREALVVNGTARLAARASRLTTVGGVLAPRSTPWDAWVQSLRPQDWAKNLIIFIPSLALHQWGELATNLKALLAFVIFSFASSGVQVLNDLLDAQGDRHDSTRKLRPFASGDLPLSAGLILCAVLLALSLFSACLLSSNFACVLGVYVVLAMVYSRRLKHVPMAKVFCLAGLYTIRLIAGYVAIRT